jgi:hypothetical protein
MRLPIPHMRCGIDDKVASGWLPLSFMEGEMTGWLAGLNENRYHSIRIRRHQSRFAITSGKEFVSTVYWSRQLVS